MQRRSFLKSSALASGAIVTGSMAHAAKASANSTFSVEQNFKLKYAPHFGMFKHSAGEDLLDQLQFMALVECRLYQGSNLFPGNLNC